MDTYNPINTTIIKGHGPWVWDLNGKKYLDTSAGIAVVNLGHTHKKINKVILRQIKNISHTANTVNTIPKNLLAKELTKSTGMDSVFFCNSGAEAVEAALKMVRRYCQINNNPSFKIISMKNAFHGRTLYSLSAAKNPNQEKLYSPLIPEFIQCEFNNENDIIDTIHEHKDVCAIILEPIQGEGGVFPYRKGYLKAIRRICDKYNLIMILDEVQTGMGRSGKLFSYQHEEIYPDILLAAKGLGNGFPIGACLARGEFSNIFSPGDHGSTFGGSPLACTIGSKVLEIIECKKFHRHTTSISKYLLKGLQNKLGSLNSIQEIRGMGLLIGIELKHSCTELKNLALKHGLIINITRQKVIRLTPPLIIKQKHCDIIINGLYNMLIETYPNKNSDKETL